MQQPKSKAIVIPRLEGRPLHVIGNEVTQKLTMDETGGAYYVFEAVTPPGGGVPPHVHQHEDEVIYVLGGEYEFMLGSKKFKATAGAVINFPRRVPHAFTNCGVQPGKTLWHVIPGTAFEQFFNELGGLPAGPPDMAQVAAIFGKYDIELVDGA